MDEEGRWGGGVDEKRGRSRKRNKLGKTEEEERTRRRLGRGKRIGLGEEGNTGKSCR